MGETGIKSTSSPENISKLPEQIEIESTSAL
jgi:hypothetical protein